MDQGGSWRKIILVKHGLDGYGCYFKILEDPNELGLWKRICMERGVFHKCMSWRAGLGLE